MRVLVWTAAARGWRVGARAHRMDGHDRAEDRDRSVREHDHAGCGRADGACRASSPARSPSSSLPRSGRSSSHGRTAPSRSTGSRWLRLSLGDPLAAAGGPAPVLVAVMAAAVWAGLRGDFTDLFVYQHAGERVLDGLAVYGSRDPVMDLPFTYPPFAAVAMVPLAVLPTWLAAALLAGRFGRRAGGRRRGGTPCPPPSRAGLAGRPRRGRPRWHSSRSGRTSPSDS